MSLKTVLSLLAAFQAVKADFSHPLHFKKVNAVAAKNIAAAKGRVTAATGNLVADQVIDIVYQLQFFREDANLNRASGSPTSPSAAAPTSRS